MFAEMKKKIEKKGKFKKYAADDSKWGRDLL
jgi:hypothetical protein